MGLCTSNVKYFAWFIVLGLDWLTQINHQQWLGLDLVSSIQQHLETSTEFENAHHNTTMYNYLYQPKPPQKLNGGLQEHQINIYGPQLNIMWSVTTIRATTMTLTTTTVSTTTKVASKSANQTFMDHN